MLLDFTPSPATAVDRNTYYRRLLLFHSSADAKHLVYSDIKITPDDPILTCCKIVYGSVTVLTFSLLACNNKIGIELHTLRNALMVIQRFCE